MITIKGKDAPIILHSPAYISQIIDFLGNDIAMYEKMYDETIIGMRGHITQIFWARNVDALKTTIINKNEIINVRLFILILF